MPFLSTQRTTLEAFTSADCALLMDLDSDPSVMQFLTDGRPSTKDECDAALGRILGLYQKHQGKFGIWKVFEKETGLYMGWFLFRPCKTDPDNKKEIELGYRLKRGFWRKGFASEISREFLALGFRDYGLDVIWAKTMKKNEGSWGVMQKIGMTFEKEFEELEFPGTDKRAVRYSLSRNEYEASQKP